MGYTKVYVYAIGFPEIRAPDLRALIMRVVIFWDLHWGPLAYCREVQDSANHPPQTGG